MELETRQEKKCLVIAVTGRMDALTADEFERRLTGLIDQGNLKLVVDMERVDYISSAGLRSILVVSKRLKADQGRLLLAGMKAAVKEVFDMTGFARILEIHPSLDAAMERL